VQGAESSPGGTTQPSGLNSVAATSGTDAWAVGSFFTATGGYQTLILHWNGTSWQRVASPDPSGARKFNILTGVAAVSPPAPGPSGTTPTAPAVRRR